MSVCVQSLPDGWAMFFEPPLTPALIPVRGKIQFFYLKAGDSSLDKAQASSLCFETEQGLEMNIGLHRL